MSVFANYNVPYEARTPAGLARIECRDPPSHRFEWLRRVTLGGRKAAGCRQYLADYRILELIITLRKTNGPVWEWIEVGAELDTTADRYQSDMRIFRQVLKTAWIHPDGPDN